MEVTSPVARRDLTLRLLPLVTGDARSIQGAAQLANQVRIRVAPLGARGVRLPAA
jgi:hypothetical protein